MTHPYTRRDSTSPRLEWEVDLEHNRMPSGVQRPRCQGSCFQTRGARVDRVSVRREQCRLSLRYTRSSKQGEWGRMNQVCGFLETNSPPGDEKVLQGCEDSEIQGQGGNLCQKNS